MGYKEAEDTGNLSYYKAMELGWKLVTLIQNQQEPVSGTVTYR